MGTISLRISAVSSRASLTEHDAKSIADSAAEWHEIYPRKKLCLRQVELHFSATTKLSESVRTLLSAFDDVKALTLRFDTEDLFDSRLPQSMSRDDLIVILQHPSIECLNLRGVSIPTMDLLNPSVRDPRLPVKPVLRRLRLWSVRLEEPSSFYRFLDQLKPSPSNQLTKKLQYFVINWSDCGRVVDRSALAALDEILANNPTLRHVDFSADYEQAWAVVRKHRRRVFPASRNPTWPRQERLRF